MRLLVSDCGCPVNVNTGHGQHGHGPVRSGGGSVGPHVGCPINFEQPITDHEYQIARRATIVSFHAMVPIEMFKCDEERVIALFRSVGLHIDAGFRFSHSHRTGTRQMQRAIHDVPEFYAEFVADNEWDLKLYAFIRNELYPSYFCRPPLVP